MTSEKQKKPHPHLKARIPGNKLSLQQKELLRQQAVEMLIRKEKPRNIASALGVNQATIYRWKSKFIQEVDGQLEYRKEDLKCKTPGFPKGKYTFLTREQESAFVLAVSNQSPDELGFKQSHWTQPLMAEFIEKSFTVKYSQRGISWLCKRLGLTNQVPKRRDYRADPELIEEWKSHKIPKIQEWGKKMNAEVVFLDESTVKETGTKLKSWGKAGQTPVVKEKVYGQKVNMLCSLNTCGHLLYSTTSGKVDSQFFLDFIKKVRKHYGLGKTIYVILDNARIHKSKMVEEYLSQTKGKVRFFFAPLQSRTKRF